MKPIAIASGTALGVALTCQGVSALLIILDNDFSSCTPGELPWTNWAEPWNRHDPGQRNRDPQQSASSVSGGVGNSAWHVHSQDAALRSRSIHDIASTTEPIAHFSAYSQFTPVEPTYGGTSSLLNRKHRHRLCVCSGSLRQVHDEPSRPASYLSAQGIDLGCWTVVPAFVYTAL
jgi:hypothetical protein